MTNETLLEKVLELLAKGKNKTEIIKSFPLENHLELMDIFKVIEQIQVAKEIKPSPEVLQSALERITVTESLKSRNLLQEEENNEGRSFFSLQNLTNKKDFMSQKLKIAFSLGLTIIVAVVSVILVKHYRDDKDDDNGTVVVQTESSPYVQDINNKDISADIDNIVSSIVTISDDEAQMLSGEEIDAVFLESEDKLLDDIIKTYDENGL